MLKVLIVDDEILVRNNLKKLICWNDEGFEVVGEASNGFSAFSMLEELLPDIIFLDVKMPVMNGIEFLKKIKELKLKTKVIMLSSYENFSYARDAMRFGAINYLLKHTLEPAALINALNEARDVIEMELKLSNEIVGSAEYEAEERRRLFFSKLLNGTADEAVLLRDVDNLNLSIKKRDYIAAVFFIQNSEALSYRFPTKGLEVISKYIVNVISGRLSEYSGSETFSAENNIYCSIVNPRGSEFESRANLTLALGKVIDDIHNSFLVQTNVYVGPRFSTLTAFRNIYAMTKGLDGYRIFFSGNIVFYDDIKSQSKACDIGKIKNILKNFNMMLPDMNPKDADYILKNLFMQELKQSMDIKAFDYVKKELLLLFEFHIRRYEVDFNMSFNRNELDKADSIEKVYKLFSKFAFDFIMNVRKSKLSDNRNIAKVIGYISRHYHEKITLESASREAHISKIYLSQLFKKETGENFIDYLAKYRIEKAKDLLVNSRMKMEEVSGRVGFANSKYFSSIFKKLTGCSPYEYRSKLSKCD